MATTATQRQGNGRTETLERPAEAPLLEKVLEETSRNLDAVADRYAARLRDEGVGRLERAMLTAEALQRLQDLVDDKVMDRVMRLMNSPLGFMTDRGPHNPKQSQPYDRKTVKECFIESLLHGLHPVGNEWNIIAGRCYVTQNGYERKVRETAGLTDLVHAPGVPTQHNGQTVVRYALSWRLGGLPGQLLGPDGKPGRPIVVPVNQYTGPDAIIGKAKRKALKAAYEQIHGSAHTLPDGEADDVAAPALPDGPPLGKVDLRRRAEPAAPDARQARFVEISAAIGLAETGPELERLTGRINDEAGLLGQEPALKLLELAGLRRQQLQS